MRTRNFHMTLADAAKRAGMMKRRALKQGKAMAYLDWAAEVKLLRNEKADATIRHVALQPRPCHFRSRRI